MAVYVQKWLSTHHPAGSCTRVQQPVSSQVPFNISKKWPSGKIKGRDMTGSSPRHINYMVIFSFLLHLFCVQECLTCNKRLTGSMGTHFICKKSNPIFLSSSSPLQEKGKKKTKTEQKKPQNMQQVRVL